MKTEKEEILETEVPDVNELTDEQKQAVQNLTMSRAEKRRAGRYKIYHVDVNGQEIRIDKNISKGLEQEISQVIFSKHEEAVMPYNSFKELSCTIKFKTQKDNLSAYNKVGILLKYEVDSGFKFFKLVTQEKDDKDNILKSIKEGLKEESILYKAEYLECRELLNELKEGEEAIKKIQDHLKEFDKNAYSKLEKVKGATLSKTAYQERDVIIDLFKEAFNFNANVRREIEIVINKIYRIINTENGRKINNKV